MAVTTNDTALQLEHAKLTTTLSLLEKRLDAILADKPDCLKRQAEDEREDSTGILAKLNATILAVKEKLCPSSSVEVLDNFVCMGYSMTDEKGRDQRKLLFIAGQEPNVRGAVRKKENDKHHEWTTIIGFHCKVNPVGFRDNIYLALRAYIREVTDRENKRRAAMVEETNIRLRDEIKKHNRTCKKEDHRTYRKEKLQAIKVHRSEIPITCNKTTAVYITNELVSFEDVLNVIRYSREAAEMALEPV